VGTSLGSTAGLIGLQSIGAGPYAPS